MLFRKLYNFLVNRGPVGCFLAGTFYITVLLFKEQLEKAAAIKKRAEALKPDAIPEFEFDELTAFGSDKVQGFAYQEEKAF